eukprot:54843_1
MALRSQQHQILFIILANILHPTTSLILDCDDTTPCVGTTVCTDDVCQINCNSQNACEDLYFHCDESNLHGGCQINCAGHEGCKGMVVTSFRDTNIMCTDYDSCDTMDIRIHGLDPNDKISATITSIGGYTSGLYLLCSGDGIDECFLDCRDNGEYYSCIDMTFDCDTPGTCRFKCENSDACCGCTIWDLFTPYTYKNSFNCYAGRENCIQEDPNTCEEDYGCIAMVVKPTFAPTPVPTAIPTAPTIHGETEEPSQPTVAPSDAPTHIPTTIPTVSPTLLFTQPPTQDTKTATCVSIMESIENIIGVTADDFRTDTELQKYTMNSTKAVIYEAFKISHIYDMNLLCKDFWSCFFLKLKSIRGNTILDIDVCTWTEAVFKALFVKIADNAEEMGAYMKNGLAWYLVDGPSYTGYDNVIINSSTRVAFSLVTPSPSQTWRSTELGTSLHQPDKPGATVGIVIAVIFVCICALIVVWAWNKKNVKIKRELAETKQRVVDLEALTGVEGDGVSLDNVAPEDQEGAEGTVGMNSNASGAGTADGYHQTNSKENDCVPSGSDHDEESSQDDHEEMYMGPGSVPGSVVSQGAGVEMVSIPDVDAIPEIPEFKDEKEEEEEAGSSSTEDEADALYAKKESLSAGDGDALYGRGTRTGGQEKEDTVSGSKDDADNEND